MVHWVINDLERFDCLKPVRKTHDAREVEYFCLSVRGHEILEEGEQWFKSLSLLEKIRLRIGYD